MAADKKTGKVKKAGKSKPIAVEKVAKKTVAKPKVRIRSRPPYAICLRTVHVGYEAFHQIVFSVRRLDN